MNGIALRAALAAGVTAGALLSTGVAFADAAVVHDASRDVASTGLMTEDGPAIDAGRRRGDITQVRTTYGGSRVTITATVREVGRRPAVYAEIKTSAGGPRFVIAGSARRGHAEVALYRAPDTESARACPGLTMHARRAKGTVSLSVPASCIGSPRWVRTSFATTSLHVPAPAEFAWSGAIDDVKYFVDIAGMKGVSEHFWNSPDAQTPLGPRVGRA